MQKKHQIKLINDGFFSIKGKYEPHVLEHYKNNFFKQYYCQVKKYFEENSISENWIKRGNTISSQISCLNHLFPIANDEKAVLNIVKNNSQDIESVLPINCDTNPQYIAFEVVSKNDNLNEGMKPTRGMNYTSIDAVILGKTYSGKNILIGVEWKFTETI